MGQGILIHLLQVAMAMIQVNVICGLPHLCTQRLEIFHRFSFAFSAFFAVEPIWRLSTVQISFSISERRGSTEAKIGTGASRRSAHVYVPPFQLSNSVL